MDRKGSRKAHGHPERTKKRAFRGNQHTTEQDTEFTSTSAQKLRGSEDMDITIAKEFGFCFVNFFTVFSAIASCVICKNCKGDIKFSPTSNRGLGFKICIECSCNKVLIDSSPSIRSAYEINRRIVFVMRLLGVGREGINLFCGLMDIGQGLSRCTYYVCLENIYEAASTVYDWILRRAISEEQELNEEAGNIRNNITVSGDGTWKKRGFSSLFGVSTLIGKYSKKVVDAVVKSSFCQGCNLWNHRKDENFVEYNKWYATHEENCSINYSGSAGKMEIDAIVEMFHRSEEKYEVRYVKYIGDGDSKTFKDILDADPYGEEVLVSKKECVGHVDKRMGTRLRNAKKSKKGIGGKGAGKLTDKVIAELTKYYGLAIRRNPNSVENMRKEIWATYYHKSSTDKKPRHQNCPSGESSWCKWRKAKATGSLDEYKHEKPPLSDKVLNILEPIYQELSRDDLLTRCIGAETQNNNESLNSLIWTLAPKHIHSGPKIVEIATFLAVIIFNEGFLPILKTMEIMGITIGQQADVYAIFRNDNRITRSQQRLSDFAKQFRIDRREDRTAQNDMFETEEGLLYGPGLAD